jgi:hypothetical protein
MTDKSLFAGFLHCCLPRNDERASDDERLFAGILDCFGRASLAMTTGGEHQFCSSFNQTNHSSDNFAMTREWRMTDKRLFAGVLDCFVPRNDERASDDKRLFASILDCFGRASLAMTRECLTTKNTVPSLRGTKQSRMMKQEETYNNEGWTTLSGFLDCFGRASLAMTTGGKHQSCSSYNPVNYLRCFPFRSRSDSDKLTAYGKNNCPLSIVHYQLNINHSPSFNQTNHSSDLAMTRGKR